MLSVFLTSTTMDEKFVHQRTLHTCVSFLFSLALQTSFTSKGAEVSTVSLPLAPLVLFFYTFAYG